MMKIGTCMSWHCNVGRRTVWRPSAATATAGDNGSSNMDRQLLNDNSNGATTSSSSCCCTYWQQREQLGLHGQENGGGGCGGGMTVIQVTNGHCGSDSHDSIPKKALQQPPPPAEVWKTCLALVFMICGMSLTGFSLVFVHERVPSSPPLPDLLLSQFKYEPWALDVCEYLLLVTLSAAYLTAFVHKHRWIVLRRIFFMVGTLFLYRSVTICVTALPSPSPAYYCEPKLNRSLEAGEVLSRVLRLAKGGGFSINGNHVYCGDYIFSGHTAILTLGYLVIREYTSPRLSVLHWTSCAVSLTGVAFLVLSHGHYTIDIVLGYWVTTRLWWMYHTAANFAGQRTHGYFRDACWWRLFALFEANVPPGPLPCEFELPSPASLQLAALRQPLKRCGHEALDWCRRLLAVR